jgi:hypothetical protein
MIPAQRPEISAKTRVWLMGNVAGLIHDVLPARQIVEDMVAQAVHVLQDGQQMVAKAKL